MIIKKRSSKSSFDKDMIPIMNKILKELYKGTKYWGKSEYGVEGIVKPITLEDDPNWSNYNFINTNYSTINNIIIPYMKELFKTGKYKIENCMNFPHIVYDKSVEDFEPDDYNPNKYFFTLMKLMKEKLFGLNSSIKNDIISTINKTRGKGLRLEDYLIKSLINSGITDDAEKSSGPGNPSDFEGTDIILTLNNKKQEGQVKSLISINEKNNNYIIKSLMIGDKIYSQDLLIFSKEIEKDKIYEFYVFNNPKDEINKIDKNLYSIDKKYLLYGLKYDNGKIKIKNINEN